MDHRNVLRNLREQSPADWPFTHILYDPKVICCIDREDWLTSERGQAVWYTHRPTGLIFTIVILSIDGAREIAATCLNAQKHRRMSIGALAQEIMRVALADFYGSGCT